jgi:hypothetical protein
MPLVDLSEGLFLIKKVILNLHYAKIRDDLCCKKVSKT